MTKLYKDLIQPDDEPRFITKFQILTEDHLPFDYTMGKDGICFADSDVTGLAQCGVFKYIHIIEENIPDNLGRFHGGPEPCLNGETLKFVQPCDDKSLATGRGKDLEIKDFGGWKCQRCGNVSMIPINAADQYNVEPQKSPFECLNEDCGRKGPFKPEYPRHLIKPIWHLPPAPIECTSAEVYSDVYNFCRKQLILKEDEYHIITIWIMASWLVDDFQTCPYLCILAPKESGKTKALNVLSELAYRAVTTVSVTAPALFRAIETWHITLLIDEAEYQIKQDTESGQALYGCLNGGYKRGSYAIRVEGDASLRLPATYDVFGFKAIAATKIFHPTLESRSIVINMREGLPEEELINEQTAQIIRAKLLFWRFEHLTKLPILKPISRKGRLIEMFIPLFTTAQALKRTEGISKPISYEDLIDLMNIKIKEMEKQRKEEEKQSPEAMIIEAISILRTKAMDESLDERDHIKVKEIATFLGWEEKGSTKTIGRKLKVMGVGTVHSNRGSIVKHLEPGVAQTLNDLENRYLK